MNKRLIIIGIIILSVALVFKALSYLFSHVKADEFHKSAVIFVIDTSKSNQNSLPDEIKYLKTLCAVLDPEDEIKILKSEESAYLIYEGSPSDNSGITKALKAFTGNDKDMPGVYSQAFKKAFSHALTMKKEGYIPAVVVIGDLEDDSINWDIMAKNVENLKKYIPEISMMFVYAHPQKLDIIKTKLNPILGEKKLILAHKENADKVNRRLINAIGR